MFVHREGLAEKKKKKRYNPGDKSRQLCASFCPACFTVCECREVGGGRTGESEGGEKMQSSACLSGHTIQHREKPFIQHSLPTTPSKLPSNSERAWMDSLAWQHRATASLHPTLHPPPLLSAGLCLFFAASSSFSFCPSSSPPWTSLLHFLHAFSACHRTRQQSSP